MRQQVDAGEHLRRGIATPTVNHNPCRVRKLGPVADVDRGSRHTATLKTDYTRKPVNPSDTIQAPRKNHTQESFGIAAVASPSGAGLGGNVHGSQSKHLRQGQFCRDHCRGGTGYG